MKIKAEGVSCLRLVRLALGRLRSRCTLLVVALVALVTVLLPASFMAGVLAQPTRGLYEFRRQVATFVRAVQGFKYRLTTSPRRLVLDVKYKHFKKLEYQREQALAQGLRFGRPDDYVPAKVQWNNRSLRAKIRLKGTFADHWSDPRKWSFNVKLGGDGTLLGMKRFSLQNPTTRDYVWEWLYMKALGREGLIASRFEFVEVVLNGKNLGLYALEEHYGRRMIEHNALRGGPIVGFNQDLAIQWCVFHRSDIGTARQRCGFWASPIDGSQTSKLQRGAPEFAQYEKAVTLLESFRRGTRRASQVFDIDQVATVMALRALFGSKEMDWMDIKFYLNPVTARLQPIDQEVHSSDVERTWWLDISASETQQDMIRLLFDDETFYLTYIKTLNRLSQPEYVETFWSEVDEELQDKLNVLYRDFPQFELNRDRLGNHQRAIRLALRPVKAVHAYLEEADPAAGRVRLRIGNLHSFPVEIGSLVYGDQSELTPQKPTILPGKRTNVVDYQTVDFVLPENSTCTEQQIREWKLTYRVWGASGRQTTGVYRWQHLRESLVDDDPRLNPPNFRDAECLVVNEQSREILVKPGTWEITSNLVIPGGYQVTCGGGCVLNLSAGASIVSYSPLHWVGSESEPIVVESRDGTGCGLVVLGAGDRSLLRNVIFRGLSTPGDGFTGAVTFYESDASLERCLFSGNRRGDDYLNLIRCEFDISSSSFSQVAADALDVDFGSGRVAETAFLKIGNDAVDVSGSDIDLTDLRIEQVGDKALSAGEASHMRAARLKIRSAEIGLCSKDNSHLQAEEVEIDNSVVAVAVFQKKSEFGPGHVEVTSLSMHNVTRPHLVEEDSTLSIDGRQIAAREKNVSSMLYGRLYGKSSRSLVNAR